MMDETMGARIRACRRKLGYSQEQLAERLNVTAALVSNYENDKIDVKTSALRELASVLNVTVGYLADGEPVLDVKVAEVIRVFAGLNGDRLRMAALEQMKVLGTL